MDWLTFPPLTALRAFAALSEAGSASAAGARLNVSHAAISQQVKALEAHLGVALVDRSGRQLTLTGEGHRLAEALMQGFGTIAQVVDAMTGAEQDRPVQISTTQLFAVGWLMPRLQRFQVAHPEVNLMINPTPQVIDMATGSVDLALRFGKGDWPGLISELLIPTDMVVAAAPSLVGEGAYDNPTDLLSYPWLQELGTADVPDWLRRQGVEFNKLRSIEMPGNLMLEGARRGQGVMVASYSNVEADIEAGQLRELFRDAGDTGYFIVTRPGVARPAAKAFIAWLRREAKLDAARQ